MIVVDSFIFYNELDLLFYRLSILNEHVDKFILVESTHTFSGHPKPLYYQENKERFSDFNDKIIHIVIDIPYKIPNINYKKDHQWQNEYYQRNCIQIGINRIRDILKDDDIILTSDVDEIPNPQVLIDLKNNTLKFNRNMLNRLALDMYYYNLYYRIGEGSNWHGIKLMTFHTYNKNKLTFQQMRVWEYTNPVPIVENGGWHLSYFGDIQFIVDKISSFSHQEYNNSNFINKKKLEDNIKNGINLLNNTSLVFIPINENKNLPAKYDTYLKKFYVN
jgi:beta-1,4-mannosyl-glycoprotein beta-1,4-N-acetylglucosaminyltransferase